MNIDLDWIYEETKSVPHQKHSRTSTEAAKHIKHKFSGIMEKVYMCIANSGGLTDEELQRELKMDGNSERPARVSLTKKGLVKDSGFERKGKSGRNAVVWTIAN